MSDDFEEDDSEELDAEELGGEITTLTCSICGAPNTFPDFLTVERFFCRECWASVEVGKGSVH